MLSYTYADLESQVLIAAVSQGLSPTIGYLHACHGCGADHYKKCYDT